MRYRENKRSLITKEQIRRIIKQNKFLHSTKEWLINFSRKGGNRDVEVKSKRHR